jgi:hypothetical protein
MKRMKLLLFFLSGLACAANLAGVHKVYVMPMSRGMDQYLANRLAGAHVFEVVTDPKLADAVFTDRLGEGFENQLEDYSPTPKSSEPVEKPPDPPAKRGDKTATLSFGAEASNKLSNPSLNSSFGRSRGTLFLVDAKSRMVVWSTYDPPKGTSGKELNRTASDIVAHLKNDLKPKKDPKPEK